jgi:hypothetical protein
MRHWRWRRATAFRRRRGARTRCADECWRRHNPDRTSSSRSPGYPQAWRSYTSWVNDDMIVRGPSHYARSVDPHETYHRPCRPGKRHHLAPKKNHFKD